MFDKPNILVVDDEERFRTILVKILSSKGLKAKPVEGGKEAIEEMSRENFDIVLLDVKMPDMNGIDVLKKMREMKYRSEVIVLTSHASVDAAVEITNLGAYDYVLKPYRLDDLMEKISNAYDRKKEKDKQVVTSITGDSHNVHNESFKP